jgi:hypothetical protein
MELSTQETNLVHFFRQCVRDAVQLEQSPKQPQPPSDPLAFSLGTLRKDAPFEHRWIDGVDRYEDVLSTDARWLGYDFFTKLGFMEREAVGQMRKRIAVLVKSYFTCEFLGADKKHGDLVVSTLKVKGRFLPSSAAPPPEYHGLQTLPYRDVVSGPYAKNCLAMVCKRDDYTSIVRHALIRYVYGSKDATQ